MSRGGQFVWATGQKGFRSVGGRSDLRYIIYIINTKKHCKKWWAVHVVGGCPRAHTWLAAETPPSPLCDVLPALLLAHVVGGGDTTFTTTSSSSHH